MAARKGPLTKRQKSNRAKKSRAFVGPPTLKSQHKSHETRRANKAASVSAAATPAAAAKPAAVKTAVAKTKFTTNAIPTGKSPTAKPATRSFRIKVPGNPKRAPSTAKALSAGAAATPPAAKVNHTPAPKKTPTTGTPTLTIAKNAPASVSGALRAAGSGSGNKATPASPAKAAVAAKASPGKKRFAISATPVISKKASKRFDIKRPGASTTAKVAAKATVGHASPAKAAGAAKAVKAVAKKGGKGSQPGRSDAAKKAWATRRANGWKPPAKKA